MNDRPSAAMVLAAACALLQDGDDTTGRPGVAEWELPPGFSLDVMPGLAMDRNGEGTRSASVTFDAGIAHGLTSDSPDFQWGVALSGRF